ncbi:MAG: Porphyromonas-type peptidyl-arginine deiminase [Candidatus Aminicenantes bacterium]|nr:Porphyromonas-type peptidyl-arginine deiminase [Candidatus Aminicenantes bacterium]
MAGKTICLPKAGRTPPHWIVRIIPSLVLLWIQIALGSACTAVPSGPRVVAEWEAAIGTLVAYPFEIPGQLLAELAGEGRLFVIVQPDQSEAAQAAIKAAGVPPSKVTLIPTTTKTPWVRDYGAHTAVRPDGSAVLVDADYVETPIFERGAPPVHLGQELRYPDRSPEDDRTPQDVARALGLQRVPIEAFVTGGNFLVDGRGTAFCTVAFLDENRTRLSDDELRRRLRLRLGIERLVVLENTEPIGIQHIDCWLKILDAGRLLVKRAPADHPEFAPIERNVALLSKLKSALGRPYEILRIDCPVCGTHDDLATGQSLPTLPAYTNALILNRSVFIPLFGCAGDEEALATWRAAMPGHRVVGIPSADWKPYDALHCRTRAVFAVGTRK